MMSGPMALAAIAAGVALGFIYTLSPLTVWTTAASGVIVWLGGRGLPGREQRWVRGLLVGAIAVRVVLIAALFLFGTPDHMWFNVFFGDEQYLLVRSMRLRHLWLGAPLSIEAFLDVFDAYGQTSYLNVIAYAQLLVGPAPYGIHLLNTTFYMVGVVVLHRLVRAAFGRVAALGCLAGVLFFPTLMVWSASALKESLNFLIVTSVMAAAVAMVRGRWPWRPLAALAVVGGLAALRTFRAGAFEMMAAGLAAGLAGRFVTRRVWRVSAAVVAVSVLALPVLNHPRVQDVALRLLRPAATIHMGHVFTRGHSYKLLDENFYVTRNTNALGWDEGVRFARRAVVSVLLFPRPWDSQSRAELAYLPEQMLWYVILLTAAGGFIVGMRRDALVTLLFAGYATVALMVVALNTGNIGTLVRHRAFALPFLITLSAVGVTALVARLYQGAASAPRTSQAFGSVVRS